jgi:predicted hotdog family 3-hydroxylacyl-ACP dehydratase
MLLVDEVVRHEGLTVVCRTTVRDDMPFVRGGRVPALLALELFAQSAASLVALLAPPGGPSMAAGALLGSRRVRLHTDELRVGDVLEMRCEEKLAIGPTAQIHCELRRGGALLAEGSINVMAGVPPEGEA